MMVRGLEIKNRIIHALDVEDDQQALRIARDVEPYVDAIKVSYPLIIRYGGKIMNDIKKKINLPIIACFKVGDIPEISSRIVDIAIESGADGLTLQGFVGEDTMTKCIEVAHEKGAYVFMVTEMSHPGAEQFMSPVGMDIAKMAKRLRSDGIVTPATRPEVTRRYREIVGKDMWIISPGVGAQGAKLGDAILAGATFEIVGRRIYQDLNPKEVAKRFSAELKTRLESQFVTA